MAKAQYKMTKPIKDDGLISKNYTWNDLMEKESFIRFPEKDEWRKRLIFTLQKWSQKVDSYELQQFCVEYCIFRKTLYNWGEKYPDVKEALDETKLVLGSRKRIGAMTKQLDKDVVFKDMHKYDPEWDEINKYHTAMKKEEAAEATRFNVYMGKPDVLDREQMKLKNEESV